MAVPMSRLYYGDNLDILREHIADASVDLVYLDPPFNSQASYNVLFRAPTGEQAQAQIEAFEDTWHWNDTAEAAFDEVMRSGNTDAAEMLRAMRSFLKGNDMMAYLAMMAVRLLELHRVLKPTGSLYLHCDPTASHYLKVLLDAIFGVENFRNEIIWKRTGSHGSSRRWGPVHDTLLFCTRSSSFTWNKVLQPHDPDYLSEKYRQKDERGNFQDVSLTGAGTRKGDTGKPWKGFDPTELGRHWAIPDAAGIGIVGFTAASVQERLDALNENGLIYWPKKGAGSGFPRIKQYAGLGVQIQDVITDISVLNSQAQERLGYPTQKPVLLLERLIAASSNPGDVVLDPFCGCGTTIHAAQKLGRRWIGIDITHLAISLIEKRLKDAFPGIAFEVHGTPRDVASARDLAQRDKYQFQWWAVSLVDAVPFGGKKKGADSGIDGLIWFKPDGKTTEKAIVSVKGGVNLGVAMIRELANIVDREKAKVGILITLEPPTKPMLKEAAAAGLYHPPHHAAVPKIQILTVPGLLERHERVNIPWISTDTFKKAAREDSSMEKQGGLL